MKHDDKHTNHTAPSLPPEVQAALAPEGVEERATLTEMWEVAGHYYGEEPSEDAFREIGADIWSHLEAAIQKDTAPVRHGDRPAHRLEQTDDPRSPLRLVVSNRVSRQVQWMALAACIVLLIAVGLVLQQQPVTISAPLGQTASVELPDGSAVELNSGSTLSYARNFGTEARTVRLEGEAFFEVTKSEHTFVVETFNGATTVLGTSFNVRAWPDDPAPATAVTVLTGVVRLESPQARGRAVTLQAGQTASLSALAMAPTVPEDVTEDYALAWRSGGFKFTGQTLGTILEEVRRRYDVRIVAQKPALLDDTVGILIERSLGAEQILRDICEYNGCEYREIAGGFEIYEPDAL